VTAGAVGIEHGARLRGPAFSWPSIAVVTSVTAEPIQRTRFMMGSLRPRK
jgi:hypothetical protein